MRIAVVAPVEMRVPPIGYGGTELVAGLLTEELVRRGHKVTLFASGDSITGARLVSPCERFVRGSGRDGSILTMLNVLACMEQAENFDIIHNHTCFEGLSIAGLVRTPVLTTLHGGLAGDWLLLFQHYKGWYNTISNSMKMLLPPKERFAGTIYNAIDVASYPFNSGKRDGYLLFLSRMSPEKGPHLAIEVARRLGMPLVLAGNVNDVDQEYFCTQVQPHLDGSLVRYVGEADYKGKRELLSRAYCLLAPITWPEPFGLFMVEAMACGTPVLVFNRGSAPEVVQHGVTGFVVDTLEEMVEAAHQVGRLDPRACRQYTECHFNVHRMVDDYEVAYRGILAIEGHLPADGAARRADGADRLGRGVARLGYGPPEEGVPMIASVALQP